MIWLVLFVVVLILALLAFRFSNSYFTDEQLFEALSPTMFKTVSDIRRSLAWTLRISVDRIALGSLYARLGKLADQGVLERTEETDPKTHKNTPRFRRKINRKS
jgi:hypothetical protein